MLGRRATQGFGLGLGLGPFQSLLGPPQSPGSAPLPLSSLPAQRSTQPPPPPLLILQPSLHPGQAWLPGLCGSTRPDGSETPTFHAERHLSSMIRLCCMG